MNLLNNRAAGGNDGREPVSKAEKPLTSVAIRFEHDVVLARQRARQIAELLGFDSHDQVRIATAVSEIARNAFRYAKKGKAEFFLSGGSPPALRMRVSDEGPGIPNLQEILNGNYVSKTGMGMGIVGARRLMDEFRIESGACGGTVVLLAKNLPLRSQAHGPDLPARIGEELARQGSQDPFAEVQRQNQELLSALDQLNQQKSELAQLNKELEDTNRGVVALYAELDERADYLRRASEVKTQFLSNMTHEFRTPLNSILSLSRILLDRIDGPLSSEQERQVQYIQKAARDLSDIVNDLLDLAKVEAGKLTIRPDEFSAANLFGALKGMLRPLLAHNSAVSLTFEDVSKLPPLRTDESKISQVLRNLISNALKFTEKGEVHVSGTLEASETVLFTVSDTGVGIQLADQDRIFEEFSQLEGKHQRGKKGTGLGLPLSRKLAELLGGSLTVESAPGVGSTFFFRVPLQYSGPEVATFVPDVQEPVDPGRLPVLVLEDNRETLFIYDKFLKSTPFQLVPARTISQARQLLDKVRPVAVILDVLLEHESSWSFLSEIKQHSATRNLPVVVVTLVENQHKALALGADAFHNKPVDRPWLIDRLFSLVPEAAPLPILIIDDDETSRYLVSTALADQNVRIFEAEGGEEGIEIASQQKPGLVILDLKMPGLGGFQVLERLRAAPALNNVHVVIHTSKSLSPRERKLLDQQADGIIQKAHENREEMVEQLKSVVELARKSWQRSKDNIDG